MSAEAAPTAAASSATAAAAPRAAGAEGDTGPLAEVEEVLGADSVEVALAKSDAALHASGSGQQHGYWNWDWRDYAAEEQHCELERSSQWLAARLSEDDWCLFAYELLVLLHDSLSEADPAYEHVNAVLPMCRVSLGINTMQHLHLVELTLPGDLRAYTPLDVRLRALLLLRAWTRAEKLQRGAEGIADPRPEWTSAWIRRQLIVLRGSVTMRALVSYFTGKKAALQALSSCLRSLRMLEEILEQGSWGCPQPLNRVLEAGGRRLLVMLVRDMDAACPHEGRWSFNTIVAAKVFSKLWMAATDADADDGLSLEAPAVASALLSGLHLHMGTRLQLRTHALLLTQHLWLLQHSNGPGGGVQLPATALATAARLLGDFSHWLQENRVNTASCFARNGNKDDLGGPSEEALELTARRLLTVELRDGLTQVLCNYKSHMEPEAFAPVLRLWWYCHEYTTRSRLLIQATAESDGDTAVVDSAVESALADADTFAARMMHFCIWQSVSATAARILAPFDEPPQIPHNDAEAWRRLGPCIKRHLDGLAAAVRLLLDEIECERSYYNRAWGHHGLASDHLSVTAAALCAAVRPRVEALAVSGVWPTQSSAVIEIPAGGGGVLQVLETLDRLARRWPEPGQRPGAGSLVDVLLPHVVRAIEDSFTALDRDVTSHTLDGSDDAVFQPLRPPALLHCECVVTLWRFVHEALDGHLSLGTPVDIVVPPFLRYLRTVLERTSNRLVRPCEGNEPFRLSQYAARVAAKVASDDCTVDSESEGEASEGSTVVRTFPKFRKMRGFTRSSRQVSVVGGAGKNVITEVALLDVDSEVTAPPIRQVSVRLSCFCFCLAELGMVYSKLFRAVNGGDDADVPTVRRNDARLQICEDLTELQDFLQHSGHSLAGYLAARLVFVELRQDLFERLYFVLEPVGGTTPRSAGGVTPTGAAPSPLPSPSVELTFGALSAQSRGPDPMRAVGLSLEAVISRRKEGLLSLVAQTPVPLLVPFVVELGTQLSHAWTYVVFDYLMRQKVDQVACHVQTDHEALKQLLGAMMQQARLRVTAGAQSTGGQPGLHGLSMEDCDDGERRLDEVQSAAQVLVLKVLSGTSEELARYAVRVQQDIQGGLAEAAEPSPRVLERAQTPTRSSQRSQTSLTIAGTADQERGQVTASSRNPEDGGGGATTPSSSKTMWKKAVHGAKKRLKGGGWGGAARGSASASGDAQLSPKHRPQPA